MGIINVLFIAITVLSIIAIALSIFGAIYKLLTPENLGALAQRMNGDMPPLSAVLNYKER